MISIIVPAHNESSVIGRTLRSLTEGAKPDELDIIVVCNGCTDDTAELARRFGAPVRVVETEIASKVHALNLGDRTARSFPRLYVDADVVLPLQSIRALAAHLQFDNALLVSPVAKVDLSGCSSLVKAFYLVRDHLPSAREGVGGSGVYALSKLGRNRFEVFPPVVADDTFVRIQFREEERETLGSIVSTVFAPRKIKSLIAIRTRAYYGNAQLARLFPELWKNRGESNHKALIGLLRKPGMWLKILVYVYVNARASRQARMQLGRGSFVWHRDASSRSAES